MFDHKPISKFTVATSTSLLQAMKTNPHFGTKLMVGSKPLNLALDLKGQLQFVVVFPNTNKWTR